MFGAGWLVSLDFWGCLVGSAGFKGDLGKLCLIFPTSRRTKWVKTEHQHCGVRKVDFSHLVLCVALQVQIKGKEKGKKKVNDQRVAPLGLVKPKVGA